MSSLESRLLKALAPWRTAPAWRVALSGGLDSTVLLHLLARSAERARLPAISAIHVHHGLQSAADGWVEACQTLCAQLEVPLQVCRVQVSAGASLEAAARAARYEAFTDALQPNEVLLTAQHAGDQAETLLFRLLRGAGPRGLAGMPAQRALGVGLLLRPLLDCARAELEAYAHEQGLVWQEDPSNADTHYARNYLRHEILPRLRQRWPQAERAMLRTAGHCHEAEQLLEELAQQDLQAAQTAPRYGWLPCPSLELDALRQLSDARQRNALRYWLAGFGELPDSDHWAGWRALRDAALDAEPLWSVAGGQLRRADGRIWYLHGDWLRVPDAICLTLQPGQKLSLPGNGRVHLEGAWPDVGSLQVRYRRPGERLQLPQRGRRDIKRLLNELALPTFMRDRLPLLCQGLGADEQVLAVANLPTLNLAGQAGSGFVWIPPGSSQSQGAQNWIKV
jgi:tRNA(Ile)-lysidine synthase